MKIRGTRIKTQKLSDSNTVLTACVGMKVHVTFKGESLAVSQRERLICFSPCDCNQIPTFRSDDMVNFYDQAEALVEGYFHRDHGNQR